MPNTAILESIEKILSELRERGETSAPLEASVREKTGSLVISMRDLLDALADNTRRLEALKNDHGAINEILQREIVHMRQSLEMLGRDFRAHDHTAPKPEERDNLRYNPTPSQIEPPILPSDVVKPVMPNDATDDAKP